MPSAILSVVASIPSPPIDTFMIGPVPIRIYALCIITGIIVAALLTNYRLTRRGGEPWVVIDISVPAIILAIIGARIYHVLTHWNFYFAEGMDPIRALYIWEGGIAIYGALIGGAVGAWLGCRWTGVRFSAFADALAPGMLLAQALGRFGNWFNQELFGLPTALPWGLEIDPDNAAIPAGLAPGTLFHPTFLYEVIWNTLGAFFLLWLGRRASMQWGRLFAVYLIWYSSGRIIWESIRIDPSFIILGLRTNVWASIFGVILGIVILVVQHRRHPGLEPSPYSPGREWKPQGALDSQESKDFVDLSEPPVDEVNPGIATSTPVSK